ncbi:hypothetical protein LR48_Vigan10g070900 [Vigna angularis]|uniref:Uncharacterized protein n=1 Tax=Phaseolus angularis TaxID=3914 RepID=A0A0L9VIS3_PHAAN|nr:hypothetical protein LR48_Vigan10g070900 [Vigna angularis]
MRFSSSKFSSSSASSNSASASAHIHADDNCNDKTDVQNKTRQKYRLQAFMHLGDVVTGILSSAATRGFKVNLVKEVKKERDGIRKDIKKCKRRSRNCRSAAVYR